MMLITAAGVEYVRIVRIIMSHSTTRDQIIQGLVQWLVRIKLLTRVWCGVLVISNIHPLMNLNYTAE